MQEITTNICCECGACCAYFRASIYWGETDEATPGGIPMEICEKLNDFFVVIKGTNDIPPRCSALMGLIGKSVHCSIYDKRASVCREFTPSWENGEPNPRCDKARAAHGLEPLTPSHWPKPGNFPRAA
ncbi:hypothetical protein SAMN02745216_00405 [Desulfatibacillum alkenivorans DSM 16219]|uniref:Zinc-or iron-chelating domain-containing protein n=1 Tax=Desulfatibacillum alkenivorans DSM 16219 TaxID=1121393 RepID=A0A1M6DMW5_9BACT|nr:YkgJ family cysteine cluster protein [Desulfatibacillum alkenivorans]SHI74318.1 hypothetical protein SAMN02745216_00405 [Desulfatibacillum alkenivorans DSM 16219]